MGKTTLLNACSLLLLSALLTVQSGCEALEEPPQPRLLVRPASSNQPAWPPVFRDVLGQTHQPFADRNARSVVLIFSVMDCPIANSYVPEINRLAAEFRSRGVAFFLVHADPTTTAAEARRHAEEYQLGVPVLLDPKHEWVRRAKAEKSPEAVVFSPSGDIIYRGRIDDRYAAVGKRRNQATTHDLKDVLEAVLAGRPVADSRTEVIGCYIPESQE